MYKLFSKVGIGPTRVNTCGYKDAGSDDSKDVVNYVPPGSSVTEKRKVTITSGVNPANMLPGPPITRPGLSGVDRLGSKSPQIRSVGGASSAGFAGSCVAMQGQASDPRKTTAQAAAAPVVAMGVQVLKKPAGKVGGGSSFAFIDGEQSAGSVDTSKSGFGFMAES
jgi:hypothetical protein